MKTSRTAPQAPTTHQAVQASSAQSAGLKAQARGMGYEEGAALVAPVQMKEPDKRQEARGSAAIARLVRVVGGHTVPLTPATLGLDRTSGGGMGGEVVGGMAELNKSRALLDANGQPRAGGDFNVGYRPEIVKPTTDEAVDPEQAQQELADYLTARNWKNGHVGDAGAFFENSDPSDGERYSWRLLAGVSASAALDIWLRGDAEGDPTIAECATAIVALQLNALRNKMGATAFDKLARSKVTPYFICPDPDKTLLKYATSDIGLYTSEDKGTLGARPGLEPGDTVYFKNHPDYIKYAPDGSWSGENCVYVGMDGDEQRYDGFGMTKPCTEKELNQHLISAFNDAAKGARIIDEAELLAAGGGLQTSKDTRPDAAGPSGRRLDDAKVKGLMGK